MSILLGPYDSARRAAADPGEEGLIEGRTKDLMVFGYQCKYYRDDIKAELENSGAMLIPWMGDSTLMVDRYDIRNHFDDKAQFGIKPSLPYHMTQEEEELELLLDRERYCSLGNDISEEDLDHSSTYGSQQSTYSSVGYNYDRPNDQEMTAALENEHLLKEHPPTDTVDIVEDETDIYYDPPGLTLPFYIERPHSKKFQSIIERTAKFISTQGQQMEIIIKTKQKYNAQFSFLHHDDRLFPYYKQLLHAIASGSYTPPLSSQQQQQETTATGVMNGNKKNESKHNSSSEEKTEQKRESRRRKRSEREKKTEKERETEVTDDSEDEAVDLHPLLRTAALLPKIKKKNDDNCSSVAAAAAGFKTVSANVNSAPQVSDSSTATLQHCSDSIASDCSTHHQTDSVVTTYPGYDVMAAYYHASQVYQVGPPPPPPDIQPIVDKTADYVAKNGEDFQRTIIQKHVDDRRFDFLHPWNQYNQYYRARVETKRQEILEQQPLNLQRLNSQGGVSFRLSSKPVTTLKLPIGVVDLHYDEEEEADPYCGRGDEQGLTRKQKLSLDSGGQIDSEFKKFLSTVKAMLK